MSTVSIINQHNPVPTVNHENNVVLFQRNGNLPSIQTNFKLNVTGEVSQSPDQFAINILEGNRILFHFNPRWHLGQTVLNATSGPQNSWGTEEVVFFPSLLPGAHFDITIISEKDRFYVTVNHDNTVIFNTRIVPTTHTRTVLIDKAQNRDVRVTLVNATVGSI